MWTTREEFIFVELHEAKLTVSEIASRLDRDEGSVQQRISKTQLQQVTWTEDDDDLLESLWRQNVLVENIRVQLAYPRSEIAIYIRANQLDLPRRSTEISRIVLRMSTSDAQDSEATPVEERLFTAFTRSIDDVHENATQPAKTSSEQAPESHKNSTTSQWAIQHGYGQDDSELTSLRKSLELRRARIVAIESLPNMSLEQKMLLRDCLGYDNWPTRFQKYDNLQAHLSESANPLAEEWSQEDERALELILTYGPTDALVIASTFFPEKFVGDLYSRMSAIFNRHRRQNRPTVPDQWFLNILGIEEAVRLE
ncbi:hypothetical protein EJ07DRAFT_176851 [Lizonia empirigonia]|nr:hypothetical protein EJ07DRAFT_176851 [Lizonia empirigonia]